MSIAFVIGRAGSGKTQRCFSRIVEALRVDPLGPPIFWILPRQATFVAERRLTCAAGLAGFCRGRVLSFEQLGQEIFADCGGSAVPEVTAIGRQMILGHLLRRHASKLVFFKSIERQAGLAAELDATFDELERAGKNTADLTRLLDDLADSGPLDVEGESLRAKLRDVRLLYDAYLAYLGQDRLDQHRRLKQVLESVQSCSLLPRATFYVDGFFEFTDHERRMLCAIAKAGAKMEITLLMDPSSPLLENPHLMPDEMGLFHRTETTYRRLWFTFCEESVEITSPVLLKESQRFDSPMLTRVEREMFDSAHLTHGRDAHVTDNRDTGVSPVLGALRRGDTSNSQLNVGRALPAVESLGGQCPPYTSTHGRDAHVTLSIERIEAPDRAAEVDAVARRVRALLAGGYRLRDIAVLVRGLESYHAPIAASFDEHDIPFFVDRRRTASHHPLLQLLRCALQAARSDWDHDSVVALMKTGLARLSLDEADELENYCLLHRVKGSAWDSPQPWAWRRDLLRRDEQADVPASSNPLLIDELRRRVADGLGPLVKLMAAGTAIPLRKIAVEIFAMFERLGVRQTLARWMSAAGSAEPSDKDIASQLEAREEHEQVWVKLGELFDQMVDLLGDERVTPTDFTDIVESGLERLDLGLTPPTVDQVLVGQADRTRCPPVKAVFVLGLNEAEFPAAPRETTVLSDRERRELGRRKLDLDPDCRRRLLDERLLGYAAFTQASQRLILCRPQGDDAGRPVAPSAFWERIGEMFPRVLTERVARAPAGDVSQIATPRQLIAGLMGWTRSTGILPVSNRDDNPDNSWLPLYQWLVNHRTDNPSVARLSNLAWPALTYTNDASLSPDAPALFDVPLKLDSLQLETMAVCPFLHFARYGLRLSQRQRADISGADLGRVYHQLLERLVGQAIRESKANQTDLFAIPPEAIHAAAMQVARTIRGELLLSTARNRYMLQRVEYTLAEVIASQKAMMEHTRYRPAFAGVSIGEFPSVRSLPVITPGGKRVLVRGKIDRVDMVHGTTDAIVVDYKLGNSFLALDRVYYGLSLQLLASLLALQGGAEDLNFPSITPTGAFYLGLLRSLEDVKHPDLAPDPAEEDYLLKNKPRGLFDARATSDLDVDFDRGRSKVVSGMKKKDGTFGDRNRTDVIDSDAFGALLAHVQRRIGKLGDEILGGNVAITPFRLNRYSPCKTCEFRGLCRFETPVNRYHHLATMKREEVMDKVRQEAADEK